MGKSTISMVIFNSYVKLPEGNSALSYFDYLVDLTWLVQDAVARVWINSSTLKKYVSYENIDFSEVSTVIDSCLTIQKTSHLSHMVSMFEMNLGLNSHLLDTLSGAFSLPGWFQKSPKFS